jgi:hypothetical protein
MILRSKVIILHFLEKVLAIFERAPRKLISAYEWRNFLKTIKPINNGIDLIRIGGNHDGGYLVPNDLEGIQILLSPGVGLTRSFEDQLYNEYHINSILVDPEFKPNHLNDGDVYFEKSISAFTDAKNITLQELVEAYPGGDLALQMDIESGEYESLSATNLSTLKRFRIIVIEFHRIDLWLEEIYFTQIIQPIFTRLLDQFHVVHIHPNTSTGYFTYKQVKFPKFAEFTFHRKDRMVASESSPLIPNPLDSVTKHSDTNEEWYFSNNL